MNETNPTTEGAEGAATPAPPVPAGIDATPLPGSEIIAAGLLTPTTGWVTGILEEKHESIVAVSFPKSGGGRFTVMIDRPRWENCSPDSYNVGDPVDVKVVLEPARPATAFVAGQSFILES